MACGKVIGGGGGLTGGTGGKKGKRSQFVEGFKRQVK